jgi:hypothetical protein
MVDLTPENAGLGTASPSRIETAQEYKTTIRRILEYIDRIPSLLMAKDCSASMIGMAVQSDEAQEVQP